MLHPCSNTSKTLIYVTKYVKHLVEAAVLPTTRSARGFGNSQENIVSIIINSENFSIDMEGLASLQIADNAHPSIHCFNEQAPDATIHFQIIDLGQQLFVWMAVGGAKFQNLYLAIQSRQDSSPSVATLLPDAASGGAAGMAQRLAKRVGRPVVCSCNLPANADMLQVIAERRLCQELDAMGLTRHSKAAGTTAAQTPGTASHTETSAAV